MVSTGSRTDPYARFEAEMIQTGKTSNVRTQVFVSTEAASGLELQDIKDCFGGVGKARKDGRRVVVQSPDLPGAEVFMRAPA